VTEAGDGASDSGQCESSKRSS